VILKTVAIFAQHLNQLKLHSVTPQTVHLNIQRITHITDGGRGCKQGIHTNILKIKLTVCKSAAHSSRIKRKKEQKRNLLLLGAESFLKS
jgi:hypothetical protein